MNRTILVEVNLEDNYDHRVTEAYQEVRDAINHQNGQGYKLISMTPLVGSKYDTGTDGDGAYGYGYGFTTALILVFEEVEN